MRIEIIQVDVGMSGGYGGRVYRNLTAAAVIPRAGKPSGRSNLSYGTQSSSFTGTQPLDGP